MIDCLIRIPVHCHRLEPDGRSGPSIGCRGLSYRCQLPALPRPGDEINIGATEEPGGERTWVFALSVDAVQFDTESPVVDIYTEPEQESFDTIEDFNAFIDDLIKNHKFNS